MSLSVDMLEESFDLLAPRREEVVEQFYARLFGNAPEVRPLFAQTDMPRQRQMLLAALMLLRKSWRDLDSIRPALQAMGARHVKYGVRPEHYPIVRTALLDTFAAIGGDAWKDNYTRAWVDAYQVVQDIMLSGAAMSPSTDSSPRAAA